MASEAIVGDYTLLPSMAGGMIGSDGMMTIDNYGKVQLNKDQMVDQSTSYFIASCTKSMTAAMIMKVCHLHGIANPMKTITMGSVLPFVSDAYKDVTLEHLLCMVSGIVADKTLGGLHDFWHLFIDNTSDLRKQRRLLTQKICGKNAPPPAFVPGSSYFYSNCAYVVAAHVIEVKFNMNYEDMMQTYLFQPLRMKAHFKHTSSSAIGHSLVGRRYSSMWYTWWYKKILLPGRTLPKPSKEVMDGTTAYIVPPALQYPPPILGPAGLVCIDIASWLRYLYVVMMHDTSFLPESLWHILLNTGYPIKNWNPPLDILDSPSTSNYSFGWIYNTAPGMSDQGLLMYTGSLPGAFTSDIMLKQYSFALVAVTNSSRASIKSAGTVSTLPLNQLELALCPPEATFVKYLLTLMIQSAAKHPAPNAWSSKRQLLTDKNRKSPPQSGLFLLFLVVMGIFLYSRRKRNFFNLL